MLTDRQIQYWEKYVQGHICDNCMTADTDRDGYSTCYIDCVNAKGDCHHEELFMELWAAYKELLECEDKEEAYESAYNNLSRACEQEQDDYYEERCYA